MSQPTSPAELYQRIARLVAETAPSDWVSAHARYRTAGTVAEPEIEYDLPDGSIKHGRPKGFGLIKAFRELRELCYQPGKGTWYTADLTISREGHFSADFDFDHEPAWHGPAPSPATFAKDAEKYPRDPEYVPDWLADKLRAAASGS